MGHAAMPERTHERRDEAHPKKATNVVDVAYSLDLLIPRGEILQFLMVILIFRSGQLIVGPAQSETDWAKERFTCFYKFAARIPSADDETLSTLVTPCLWWTLLFHYRCFCFFPQRQTLL